MNTYEWLGQWEQADAPGKHQHMEPAIFAHGYQYCGQRGPVHTMWDCVNRAIPVEGTVKDPPPSWSRSPQVLCRLGVRKPGLLKRIADWLNAG